MSQYTQFRGLVELLVDPQPVAQLDRHRWNSLIATARRANLLGALANALDVAGIDSPVAALRHLNGALQLSQRQRQSVVWEAHQLCRALASIDAPVVLLKGAAYVLSQAQVARGRTFGDIDILVPRAHLGDVESQLMLDGWVSAKTDPYDQLYYRQWMHEIPPMTHIRRGTVLDVHHTILPLTARYAPDPTLIIARSRPVPAPGLSKLLVPCPEDLVIHSITHLVHEGELHNGLRDLHDIDRMLRIFADTSGFWTRLSRYAGGNDLARPVLLGLTLAAKVFSTPIPQSAMIELAQSPHGGSPRSALTSTYIKALQPFAHDDRDLVADVARWLIYVRSHALRMPFTQLIRHLVTKAWMGARGSLRESENA